MSIIVSMELLKPHFGKDIMALFRQVLTATFFCVGGEFNEQTGCVTMGPPLSSVVSNFFMEHFEERALEQANHKPRCWVPLCG